MTECFIDRAYIIEIAYRAANLYLIKDVFVQIVCYFNRTFGPITISNKMPHALTRSRDY